MNSNGCVQAWIDIKCVESSLKPYMNTNSEKYMREAVRPLLDLEKEKDVLLVKVCCKIDRYNMKEISRQISRDRIAILSEWTVLTN